MINDNARFLTPSQLEKHVTELNRPIRAPLQFEWEVALLWGLSRHGSVTHEPELGGYAPDILFGAQSQDEFVAEITTVSDQGNQQKALIEVFQHQFWRERKRRGLTGSGFHWSIARKKGDDPKEVLMLPPRAEIDQIFDDVFQLFLDDVIEQPGEQHVFERRTDDTDLRIEFRPRTTEGGGHSPTYTEAYHLTRNPIFNALKGKKSCFRKLNYDGPRIIILCDGGCNTLRHDPLGGDAYGVAQIVREFLRQNTSVSAVAIVSTHTDISSIRGGMVARIELRQIQNPDPRYPLSEKSVASIRNAVELLPNPVYDAVNASSWYRSKKGGTGISHFGGSRRQGHSISFSAREIVDLLAGNITQGEFYLAHRYVPRKGETKTYPNPVKIWSDQGRMLVDVNLVRSEEEDDDWITLHLGDPDPAISRFVNPKADQLRIK